MTDRAQVTDAKIEAALEAAASAVRSAVLKRIAKHGRGLFVGKMEGLGVVTEEYHELIDACRSNNLRDVRDEAMDVAVGALWLYASIDPTQCFTRDPDSECQEYAEGPPEWHAPCDTDGHHLCAGCKNNKHRVEHDCSTQPCAFPANVNKETP